MKSYDKSLLEVWEWKELVYKDFKDLTSKEYVEKIKMNAEKLLLEEAIILTSVSDDKNHYKIA